MSFLWSLVIVFGAILLAVLFSIAFGANERKQHLLQVVIVVTSTFAGVFLGLGLDKIKNDRDDRNLAAAYLRAETLSFVEQIRPWFQEARKYPRIALTTPSSEQRKQYFLQFEKYMPTSVLHEVDVKHISEPRITKSFDETFLIIMNQSQVRLNQANSIFRLKTSSTRDKYRAFHDIIELSSGLYTLMCMQTFLVSGIITSSDFESYLNKKISYERAYQIGCFEPQWGRPALIRSILRQAAEAGAEVSK